MGGSINSIENDSGRRYQSLSQSSYSTWEDGPFGAGNKSSDETISYYVKGPVVGMLLDLDYTKYPGYAGLELNTVETISPRDNIKRNKLIIKPQENLNPLQARILESWMYEQK